MIRHTARQNAGFLANQTANEASIETKRHDLAHEVGGVAGPHIAHVRHHAWANQIAIAEYGSMLWQDCKDLAKLTAIENLAVGKMNIRHGEVWQLDNLTNALHQHPGL